MEAQAKVLADLIAAISSINAKLDDMYPVVLELNQCRPGVERAVDARPAEVGDLRARVVDATNPAELAAGTAMPPLFLLSADAPSSTSKLASASKQTSAAAATSYSDNHLGTSHVVPGDAAPSAILEVGPEVDFSASTGFISTAPTTCSTVCLPQQPVSTPVLVASSPPTLAEYDLDTNSIPVAAVPRAIAGGLPAVLPPVEFGTSGSELFRPSSSQRIISIVPVHRPMPWPSFMGVHADGDEARPRPWPTFKGINDCESSSDAIMKPSRRCTSDSFPMTIGDVVEFQIPDYYGNLYTSTSLQLPLVMEEVAAMGCMPQKDFPGDKVDMHQLAAFLLRKISIGEQTKLHDIFVQVSTTSFAVQLNIYLADMDTQIQMEISSFSRELYVINLDGAVSVSTEMFSYDVEKLKCLSHELQYLRQFNIAAQLSLFPWNPGGCLSGYSSRGLHFPRSYVFEESWHDTLGFGQIQDILMALGMELNVLDLLSQLLLSLFLGVLIERSTEGLQFSVLSDGWISSPWDPGPRIIAEHDSMSFASKYDTWVLVSLAKEAVSQNNSKENQHRVRYLHRSSSVLGWFSVDPGVLLTWPSLLVVLLPRFLEKQPFGQQIYILDWEGFGETILTTFVFMEDLLRGAMGISLEFIQSNLAIWMSLALNIWKRMNALQHLASVVHFSEFLPSMAETSVGTCVFIIQDERNTAFLIWATDAVRLYTFQLISGHVLWAFLKLLMAVLI